MKLQGIYAAVATPFDHTGAMYRVKVQHNFEKWSRTSLAGFIVGSLPGNGVRERKRKARHVLPENDPVACAFNEALKFAPCPGDYLLGLVAGRSDLLPVRHAGEHVVAQGVDAPIDHLGTTRAVEELPAAGFAKERGWHVSS